MENINVVEEIRRVEDLLEKYNIAYEEKVIIVKINWSGGVINKYPYTVISVPEEKNWKYRICFYSPLVDYGYGNSYSCSERGKYGGKSIKSSRLENFIKGMNLEEDEEMIVESDTMTVEVNEEDVLPKPESISELIERFQNEARQSGWLSDSFRERIKFDKFLSKVITEAYNAGRREKNTCHNGYPYESPFVN